MFTLKQAQEYSLIQSPLSIQDIRILQGANYFSGDRVVRMRLDLQEYDEVFTNEIPGFYKRLKRMLPGLYEHHCSYGVKGGFLRRVKEGTLLGHVMEHVTIELQTAAGMDVGFGKTRMTKTQGVYNVVFRFFDELAGVYAGKAAFNLISSILTGKRFGVKRVIENLIYIREERLLGFSTAAIVAEAERRNIPTMRLDDYSLVQLGTGKYRKLIRATVTQNTGLIAVETTDNKYRTTCLLSEIGIPVPQRKLCTKVAEAIEYKTQIKKPLVIKPALGGYKGKCVSVNLTDKELIKKAFNRALSFDKEVIVQEFIKGYTYRLLTIDGKFAAAVMLEPPYIVGTGKDTVRKLIRDLNNSPDREYGDKGKLTKIVVDYDTKKLIESARLTLNSVLKKGKRLDLKNTGSLSEGGKAVDVTDNINEYNKFLAERISKNLNLDVAGVDIISEDISVPITDNGACVIEVNAAPDFRMHINPYKGFSRKVENAFIDMLFPEKETSRIPLIAVTGGKGSLLATKLINYALSFKYTNTGLANSEGLLISGHQIKEGDYTGAAASSLLLKDSSIDCASIEVPVETILNEGIGYKFSSVGIVLNLSKEPEKFYEYDHIRDEDDLAYAKSVVAEEVYKDGYTILNGDEDFIFEMRDRLYSTPITFSRNIEDKSIQRIINEGEIVCISDSNDKITVYEQGTPTEYMFAHEVLFFNKDKAYTYDVILATIALLHAYKFDRELIIKIMTSYH